MFEILSDYKKDQEFLNRILERKRKVLLFMKGSQKLPDDIIRKIYEEYLKPDMLYEDLIYTLQLRDSKRLNIKPLKTFIPQLLQNKIFVEYLRKKDSLFNDIYTTHIINKTNTYVNAASTIDSMAITWLTYLYH
jgi:hypothetical protein